MLHPTAVLLLSLPFSALQGQPSTRTELVPSVAESASSSLGGVPSGYMILGPTPIAPSGYSYTGKTLSVTDEVSWTQRAPSLTSRSNPGMVVAAGRIYLLGGLSTTVPEQVVEEYDPSTDTWSFKSSPILQRDYFAVAECGGLIFVVGGFFDGSYVGTIEAYDPSMDSWSLRAPIPTPRNFPALAEVGGMLYAIGGHVGFPSGSETTVVERYDPVSDTWSTVSPLNCQRSGARVASAGGQLFVFGGYHTGGGVGSEFWQFMERYDPELDTWTVLSRTPYDESSQSPSWGKSAAVVGASIYPSTAWEYDTQADTWRALDALGIGRGPIVAFGSGLFMVHCDTDQRAFTLTLPARLFVHAKN